MNAQETPPPPVEVQLFGLPKLRVAGRDCALALKRAPALLAYLANAGRPVPREHLATLLWPDASGTQARTRLRRLTYAVEQSVSTRLFDANDESIALLAGRVHVDTLEFARMARSAVTQPALDEATTAFMQQWAWQAGQPMLQGVSFGSEVFDDWLDAQRIEHQHLLARLMTRLIESLAQRGEFDAAFGLAEKLLALDPHHEPSYVLLMQLQAQRGNASGVEAAFTRCADALRAEYGIKPGVQTEHAYLCIVEDLRRQAAQTRGERFDVKFAEAGDGMVAYATLGTQREAIIIAPGFVSNIEVGWEEPCVRAFIRQLAGRLKVVVFDRRGVGLSERLNASASADAMAADMLAILDHAGIEKTWIFGGSEGAPAAIRLAVHQPQRVSGLVLFDAMAKGSWAPDYPWALPAPAFEVWLNRLVAAWGGPAGIETFAPSEQHDPTLRAWWSRMVRYSVSPGGLGMILRGMRDVDVRADLPRVRVPTLVMHRRGDRAVRFGAGAYLAAQIPGAQWLPLDGDAHWWWCGDWAEVADTILSFEAKTQAAFGVDGVMSD
jgi:pimeloyl-ACP methyl ester carboxylesterase/DNA-binding SARP family transcriptional activator